MAGIKDPGEAPDLQDVIKLINSYGGGSSAGSSATAKSEADKAKRFIKAYRNLLISIYGMRGGISPWHKKIMAVAAKNELTASTFMSIIRRYDPKYVRTEEYQDRAGRAQTAWQKWAPEGAKMPEGFINKFARSMHNASWLDVRLQQLYRKDYKFMRTARDVGSQAGYDPTTYRAYRDALNASYRNFLGREATPLEQRMMFHSGMTDSEFQAALANVFGGAGSFRWAQGYVPQTKQLQTAAFGYKAGDPLFGAIGRAKQTQEQFMTSKFKPFDFGLDDQTEDIVMPRI